MTTSRHNIKFFTTFISIILSLFFSTLLHAELVDRIVAIVDDDIITFSDLNNEGEPFFKKIREQAPSHEVDDALLIARQEMLTSLIDKLIIEQRAQKLGISVGEEEINKAVEGIIARNNTNREDFIRNLKIMGGTEESFRASLKNQILQSKLIDYEIRSKVVVTEEKMKDYYTQNYTQKTIEGAYHILQMGFQWGEYQNKKEAAEKATNMRNMVIEGGNFKELARKFSDLPSAVDGGDIGVFKENELAPYMKNSILTIRPGEISPIVETPSGYQFFKLLSTKGDVKAQASYESVKDDIKNILYQQEAESQYEKWVTELRDQAYIKKLL